jgi:hypothetical protein
MSDWLRGECLFDPSPEDIARYGLRNYIPEDEKVLWIGRPTWASYVLLKGKITILGMTTTAIFTFGGSPNYYANFIPVFFLIYCFSFVLDWVVYGKNVFYFFSSRNIGIIRKKRFITPIFWRWGRNFLYPISLTDQIDGYYYKFLNIGSLTFSDVISSDSGRYERRKINQSPDWNLRYSSEIKSFVRSKGALSLLLRQLNLIFAHDDLNKFVGISNVEQVSAVLKQAVMTYWSDRLNAPLSKTEQL